MKSAVYKNVNYLSKTSYCGMQVGHLSTVTIFTSVTQPVSRKAFAQLIVTIYPLANSSEQISCANALSDRLLPPWGDSVGLVLELVGPELVEGLKFTF